MVTTSEFDGGRRTVSFDRVELGGTNFPEHPFELSQSIDLTGDGLPTVTWIYDSADDAVTWSSPLEELFGFPVGIRGFSVVQGSPDDEPEISRPPADFGDPADIGADLLAPILTPIRAGVPPAEFDLHYTVTCPDGTTRVAVIRASPLPDRRDPSTSTLYGGVVIDVTAQQKYESELSDLVDRYRLLTEVTPDVVIVHQDGLLVYGNRASVKLFKAKTMWDHYGEPVSDYVHPDDVNGMIERLARLTEPGQFFEHGEVRAVAPDGTMTYMELTSIRTTWGGKPAYQAILRDVSERRAAEAAARYRASLVAHVSDAIIGIDADGCIESWNEAAQVIYGWSEGEVSGKPIGTVVSGNRSDSAALLERGQHSHHRKDGSTVDVLVSIDPLVDDDTMPSGWVVVITELTDARQAEAGRRAAEERYEAVVESLSEGIILFDEDGRMTAHNQAAEAILGDRLDQSDGYRIFTGKSIATTDEGFPLTPTMFPHVKTLVTGESEDGAIIGMTDERGNEQWLSVSSRLLSGAIRGDAPMVVCSFTDVTARKAAERRLTWLAYHDALTSLGNRSFFNGELQTELLLSMQNDSNLAVLFLDLDRFKLINDSFGHATGDELLLELAGRFKSRLRKTDKLGRFSGDEFVVLCTNVRDADHAMELAGEYAKVVDAPFQLSTHRSIDVTCCVGVAYVEGGRQSAQDILQQADTAMLKAKGKGSSRIEMFDEALRVNSVEKLEMYDDLRRAIDHDELVVHYQPIASIATGRIDAFEALVRWNHPSRGLLGPVEFIPFAEETDLIISLGRWVLREACHTMARWRKELPGAEEAYISVNLSVHQLSDTNLLTSIAAALADSGLPPEALVLEVTESLIMSDTQETVDAISGIHAMGIGLAIDDFGTGQSSLERLKRLPVQILKIDKSFVDGLGTLREDEAIVAAIVQLSRALKLTVLAEGVETPEQLERVAALGCDLYQGYLMSRPISADRVDFKKRAEVTPQTDLPA